MFNLPRGSARKTRAQLQDVPPLMLEEPPQHPPGGFGRLALGSISYGRKRVRRHPAETSQQDLALGGQRIPRLPTVEQPGRPGT
jgi:hypothetical protein